ncbi:hypothetical protein [Actinomyces sp. MRS3W]|uniref:hypothetical protein n=1 Tax=Actinomyces sp. MRS3W TaxID=2800796 RepID=UPI0028FD7E2E|nr:hypothetical protein [Actinomyces sp. MRS3W]MDU0347653.1 hypothetical protein [Actinomyces sp. MRS3W]
MTTAVAPCGLTDVGCKSLTEPAHEELLDADLDLVDESYLPAIGAAGMCGATVADVTLPEVTSRRVSPRPEWVAINDDRWDAFRVSWTAATGRELLPEI